jgi:hypothetical protein
MNCCGLSSTGGFFNQFFLIYFFEINISIFWNIYFFVKFWNIFFYIIFLYIYSIWAILEGWEAWNGLNIIRGLAHLSSSMAFRLTMCCPLHLTQACITVILVVWSWRTGHTNWHAWQTQQLSLLSENGSIIMKFQRVWTGSGVLLSHRVY